MLVELVHPDRTAARRVHGVRVGLQVAEEHRPSGAAGRRAVWRHEKRRAHGGLRAERPVGASGRGVERMDVPAVAGDEQTIADERRLRACGRHVGVAEGPLQCQLRQVPSGQAAIPGESCVLDAVAPPIPITGRDSPAKRRRRLAGHDGRSRRCASQRASPQILRDGAPVGVAQRRPLDPHLAVQQCVENRLRAELPQRRDARGVGGLGTVGRAVARRTIHPERLRPVLCAGLRAVLPGARRDTERQRQREATNDRVSHQPPAPRKRRKHDKPSVLFVSWCLVSWCLDGFVFSWSQKSNCALTFANRASRTEFGLRQVVP